MKTVYLFLAAAALAVYAAAPAQAGDKRWECSRYVNGEWEGQVVIWAPDRQEAERLAEKKYREDIKKPFDRIRCR